MQVIAGGMSGGLESYIDIENGALVIWKFRWEPEFYKSIFVTLSRQVKKELQVFCQL